MLQDLHEPGEQTGRIQVLFSVAAHHEVLARCEAQPGKHIRRLDLGHIVVQNLIHRAAGFDNPIRGESLANQVLPGDLAIGQHLSATRCHAPSANSPLRRP